MKHILHPNIASSSHHIVVHLIGVGGTGSHMLTNLAMIASSMPKIERQPLFVRAFDFDEITENNIGRQNFSPADVGLYKAPVLVSRINRFYGFQWEAEVNDYNPYNGRDNVGPDFIISCVDSVEARKDIARIWLARKGAPYWMDIGNDARKAQIILGASPLGRERSKKDGALLPDFFTEFPGIEDDPGDTAPSCSALEALGRQDLFINKIIASYAAHMLWQLLKDYTIDYRGMYINLETLQINKIPIKA